MATGYKFDEENALKKGLQLSNQLPRLAIKIHTLHFAKSHRGYLHEIHCLKERTFFPFFSFFSSSRSSRSSILGPCTGYQASRVSSLAKRRAFCI